MNDKKVGNYGGGGAVQKLHPRKAPTLAIIKVIIKAIILITDVILIFDAGIERGFVDRPRHKVDHHRLHPLQRQHQHVLHCQGIKDDIKVDLFDGDFGIKLFRLL